MHYMFQPKNHKFAEWIKIRPLYIQSTRDHFRPRNIYRLKVRAWRKIFHANRNQKKAEAAILTYNKVTFK